jgi:hypothetical protein
MIGLPAIVGKEKKAFDKEKGTKPMFEQASEVQSQPSCVIRNDPK